MPLIISAVLLLVIRKKQNKVISGVYIFLGFINTLAGSNSNLTGAIFYSKSFYLSGFQRTWGNLIKALIMVTSIACRNFIYELEIFTYLNLIVMYCFFIGLEYFCHYRKKYDFKIKDDQTKQIIDYMLKGLTRKEIAAKVFMKIDTVNTRIRRLSEKMGCNTPEHLTRVLIENGHGTQNSDKTLNP